MLIRKYSNILKTSHPLRVRFICTFSQKFLFSWAPVLTFLVCVDRSQPLKSRDSLIVNVHIRLWHNPQPGIASRRRWSSVMPAMAAIPPEQHRSQPISSTFKSRIRVEILGTSRSGGPFTNLHLLEGKRTVSSSSAAVSIHPMLDISTS